MYMYGVDDNNYYNVSFHLVQQHISPSLISLSNILVVLYCLGGNTCRQALLIPSVLIQSISQNPPEVGDFFFIL